MRPFAFAALLCLATQGWAQDFPNKAIRLVIPLAPGGSTDFISRLVAQHMAPLLGQSVLVENRPGGGGLPAVIELMRSAPDGYTIMGAEAGQWAIVPAMRTDLPYNPLRDFVPIGLVFTGAQFIVARGSVPANTLQELIALARAKPGSLQYGSPQNGGIHHLIMESFKVAAGGLDIEHVPYKSSGEATQAVLRGDVPLMMSGITAASPHVKTGQLKLIAVATATRSKYAPDIPTVAEAAGLPGFSFAGQLGLIAPAGTPKPAVDKLSAALNKGATHPDLIARTQAAGIEMTPSTPEQLGEVIRDEVRKFANAVKAAGLKQH